jgi:hypothetical protein
MSRDSRLVVLGAVVRLSGSKCVLDADAVVDESYAARPMIIGRAIATHGRSDSFVRSMVTGVGLPDLLQREIEKRKSA